MESKTSWFGGTWFPEDILPKRPVTTTTHRPLTTAPSSWFQTLLDSEESDGAYVSNDITISKNCLMNGVTYKININELKQLATSLLVVSKNRAE